MKTILESWQGLALLSAAFAALTAIFGKLGVTGIDADLATFIRTVVILGVTAALVTLRGAWHWTAQASWKPVLFLVLSGIATGLSWLCYYRALKLGPASSVAPLDKLSVAMVVVLAALFLGETITWRTALGAGLVVTGAIVLIRP